MRFFAILMACVATAACQSVVVPPATDGLVMSAEFRELIEAEKTLYRSTSRLDDGQRADARPVLGIALSGGGARSAAVSIGFMEALTENNVLQQADVLSSNSGGSYASFWYASQIAELERQRLAGHVRLEGDALRMLPFGRRLQYCEREFTDNVTCLGELAASGYEPFASVPKLAQHERVRARLLALSDMPRSAGDVGALGPDREPAWVWSKYHPMIAPQNWLEESGNECFYQSNPVASRTVCWLEAGMRALTSFVFGAPARLLGNVVFDWRLETSAVGVGYEDGLKRRFGLHAQHPADARWGRRFVFTNGAYFIDRNPRSTPAERSGTVDRRFNADVGSVSHYGMPDTATSLRFGDLMPHVDGRNNALLPYPVITAAAAYGKGPPITRHQPDSRYSKDIRQVAFEFTPLALGGEAFGYCPYDLAAPSATSQRRLDALRERCRRSVDVDVGKAAQISGAVGELMPWEGFDIGPAINLLNLDPTRYVPNPRVSAAQAALHKALPFPLYLMSRPDHDERGTDILLEDGNVADNTGLYALLKRRVEKAIVLDNTIEGEYLPKNQWHRPARFADLKRLQRRLFESHRVRLVVDGYVSPQDGWALRPVPLAAGDPCQAGDARPLNLNFDVKWSVAQWTCYERAAVAGFDYQRNTLADAYLHASVCLAPVAEASDGSCMPHATVEILWVKLSVRSQCMVPVDGKKPTAEPQCLAGHRYNRAWTQYFRNNAGQNAPHHSTLDQEYSAKQYAGLRDFGYDLGKLIFASGDCVAARTCDLEICHGTGQRACTKVTGSPGPASPRKEQMATTDERQASE